MKLFSLLLVCQLRALVGITAVTNQVSGNGVFSIEIRNARIRANDKFPIRLELAGPLPNVQSWPAQPGGLSLNVFSSNSLINLHFSSRSLASKASATKNETEIFNSFSVSPIFQFLPADESQSDSFCFCFSASCFTAIFKLPVPPDKPAPMEPNSQKLFASSEFNRTLQAFSNASAQNRGPVTQHNGRITSDIFVSKHEFSIPIAFICMEKRAPPANGILFTPNQVNYPAVNSHLVKQRVRLLENSNSLRDMHWPNTLLEEFERHAYIFNSKPANPHETHIRFEQQFPINGSNGIYPPFSGVKIC